LDEEKKLIKIRNKAKGGEREKGKDQREKIKNKRSSLPKE